MGLLVASASDAMVHPTRQYPVSFQCENLTQTKCKGMLLGNWERTYDVRNVQEDGHRHHDGAVQAVPSKRTKGEKAIDSTYIRLFSNCADDI